MEIVSNSAPFQDQIEVTLLGPGYGECCLIHIGNNKWVIIDSCRGPSDAPAAIDYLESIGVEPRHAVIWLIVTHWHDDHIYGIADLAQRCELSEICISGALQKKEFVARIAPYTTSTNLSGGSGIRELCKLTRYLNQANRAITNGYQDRRLFLSDKTEFRHGRDCELWTLSPSDAQVELFFASLSQGPQVGETKRRLHPTRPNHLSTVTFVKVGELGLILGGDLEESGAASAGWTKIVESKARPRLKSKIFKVPHHGSVTAHCDAVWQSMLMDRPISIATPFNRLSTPIPTQEDVTRIKSRSLFFYLSSRHFGAVSRRHAAVEKTLRDVGAKIRPIGRPAP